MDIEFVEIPNPDAKLLEDYMARLQRARNVMIRRKILNWKVRKRPEIAALLIKRIDDALKANAHAYMWSAP